MVAFYAMKIKDGTITIEDETEIVEKQSGSSAERVGEKHMEIRAGP